MPALNISVIPAAAGIQFVGLIPNARPLAGLRILVAEDEVINQMVLEDILSENGAVVVLVDNGLAAVAQAQAHGPTAFDLALMDI